MTLLSTLVLFAVHLLALFGWGCAVTRTCRLPALTPPLTAALGLGAVVALGGVLNLAHLVHPVSLWLVVAVGLGCAAVHVRSSTRADSAAPAPSSALGYVASGLVLVLVAATLVPSLGFNYHDDFQKYFVHPVRMLQTGRAQGSVLSAIGFETLGAQAWLQTFVLNVAGVDALNAVDLGLGLPLTLAILSIGPTETRTERALRWVAGAAVLVINPQIVNISAAFTGSALAAAALLLPLTAHEAAPDVRRAWASGGLLAALVALKTSFALLALAVLSLVFVATLARTRSPSQAFRWVFACGAAGGVCLAPWLLAHASSFEAALHAAPAAPAPKPLEPYSVDPFSNDISADVGYGDGLAPYTAALLLALAAGAIAMLASSRDPSRRWLGQFAFAVALGAVGLYVVMLYVVGPASHGSITALRLFIPMLLAMVPSVLVIGSLAVRGRVARARVMLLVAALLAIAPFTRTFGQRGFQALAHGFVLGFSKLALEPWYVDYNAYVLHGGMREQVAVAQAKVPRGATLIAWINAPFWLDFRRNAIHDLDLAGLETPWSRIPSSAWIIWEYNGVATPQLDGYAWDSQESGALQARTGAAGMRLARAMIDLARHSHIVYDDTQIMVLHVRPDALQSRYSGR